MDIYHLIMLPRMAAYADTMVVCHITSYLYGTAFDSFFGI